MKQTEADLKRTVKDYLTYGENQGKWWFEQLNSGSAFVGTPQHPRKIKLCREGTADFIVLKGDIDTMLRPRCRVVFLELKSEKGRWSPEQRAFKIIVENQGASYFIIKSIEQLMEILE